ncbi:restriction endonuclease subunit S [Neptuniibacter marinus]|uniref:restriction endonuclease subunit S n=1 Tax=Neptuniibacter marinus TaxID=1806670 RepID=UPI00082D4C99|nr:restriction endonuclease subunit S [Neptuniibacter marinus]
MSLEGEVFTLDELGYLGRGKSKHRPRNDPQLYGGGYPFVQTGDVKAANLYLKNYSGTYNDFGLAQSKLWKKGTLVITIAANIAETAVLGQDSCFPDSVVGFEPNEDKVNSFFIKYYIDHIKREMQSISQGTTQDNLSLEKLRTFKLKVPCKQSVDKITEVLLSYDNLIENNNRRIAILEEMAQSLYREWFVKFRFPGHDQCQMVDSPLGMIPEEWEIRKLEDVADVNPESIKPKSAPEQIHYIDIKSVSTGKIDEVRTLSFSEAPSRARRIVRDQDVIWATVRPNRRQFSYICKPIENTIASTGFAVLRAKNIPASYLYFFTTTDSFTSYLVNHASGAAYPAVNTSDFNNADILLPSDGILAQFDNAVKETLILSENLKRKNENLRKQRDLLLPKLISGQIDLSQAEQALA